MADFDPRFLLNEAVLASRRAVAPYSKFRVGAALLTREGNVIRGANVESVSYGLTCCAERIALFKALTEGHKDFIAVAIVAPSAKTAPCGACRQLLAEYAAEARVFVADSRRPAKFREFSVDQLLPEAFRSLRNKRARK
ncbi:MAG: cytidine deaminase [Proteobacteria bacterium]|nr:cytidine deaminase [Verrucomicrobiota bacterium]NBU10107.1 cytidine deaminase [Pseudomonadota bacterium]